MYVSSKSVPQLRELPAGDRRRAWRGGARYALNRWPFLLLVVGLIVGASVLDVDVIGPLVPSKLMFVVLSIVNVLIVHYARRELRERVADASVVDA